MKSETIFLQIHGNTYRWYDDDLPLLTLKFFYGPDLDPLHSKFVNKKADLLHLET